VALALLLLALGTVGFQLVETRLPRRVAKLTPLTTVNAAWATADGYVLEFTIYDADSGEDAIDVWNSRPNFDRFCRAARLWADQQGLRHTEPFLNGPTLLDNKIGCTLQSLGGGRMPGEFTTNDAQLTLRLDDAQAVDDLTRTLAALPGVSEPEVSRRSLYLGIGGLTQALEGMKVVINGAEYRFPEDFSPTEAQALYWRIRGVQEHGVEFRAYPQHLLSGPDGQQRIALGDVIRLGFDPAGRFVISNVLEHWNPGVTVGLPNGWGFHVPPSMDERQLDPVRELSRMFSRPAGDSRPRHYTSLTYWLVPRAQVLTQGGLKITSAQKQQAVELAGQLQRAIDGWVEQHPETKGSLLFGNPIGGKALVAGPDTVAFRVRVSSDDPSVAGEIEKMLRQTVGVTDPDIRQLEIKAPR
jgi:hypothetical protein